MKAFFRKPDTRNLKTRDEVSYEGTLGFGSELEGKIVVVAATRSDMALGVKSFSDGCRQKMTPSLRSCQQDLC